jgi:hypothetical protein
MKRSSRGEEFRRLRGAARERAARVILARWEGSELSKAAFCRQEGIASVTLTRWLTEFGAGAKRPTTSGPGFVEAVWSGVADAVLEVVLPTGVRVRVPRGFDEGYASGGTMFPRRARRASLPGWRCACGSRIEGGGSSG